MSLQDPNPIRSGLKTYFVNPQRPPSTSLNLPLNPLTRKSEKLFKPKPHNPEAADVIPETLKAFLIRYKAPWFLGTGEMDCGSL